MTLFDDAPFRVELEPVEKLSAGRRRTRRQAEVIALGYHPLSLISHAIGPLHPEAEERGLTCGSCIHRIQQGGHTRDYPKCEVGPRSFSAASDCRAWWPACTGWKERP